MNQCWMIPEMELVRVAIVYVHVVGSPHYEKLSRRFVDSYLKHPPNYPHQTIIVCNGGLKTATTELLFERLPRVQFIQHDNSGRDIGAFQLAAKEVPCELMAFFGGSTYFRRDFWLQRMVDAYRKHGVTLFGATAHSGTPAIHVYPHIRTTAFWTPPALMNLYPMRVQRDDQRYPFEHGRHCFTDWVSNQGMTPLCVTYAGEYSYHDWDRIPGGYHRDQQENLLAGDRLCEPPYFPHP
jgi:hypothetical protein